MQVRILPHSLNNNKMKLEPKHLAPYLPHKLKMKVNDGIGILKGILQNVLDVSDPESIDSGFYVTYNECKPILRPLSDIEKETADHGFVLHNLIDTDKSRIKDWLYTYGNLSEFNFHERLSFGTVMHLIENHFDVHGLIEAGLAIDMNTLKSA